MSHWPWGSGITFLLHLQVGVITVLIEQHWPPSHSLTHKKSGIGENPSSCIVLWPFVTWPGMFAARPTWHKALSTAGWAAQVRPICISSHLAEARQKGGEKSRRRKQEEGCTAGSLLQGKAGGGLWGKWEIGVCMVMLGAGVHGWGVALKGSKHEESCFLLPFPHKRLKVVTRRNYCGVSLPQEVQSGEVWLKS